jgi:hypothetical protein
MEKLVDKIERLKERQGAMKRANHLSAKRIAKASRILVFPQKQSLNSSPQISPAGLASPITPSRTTRPTSADLRNAWPQSKTPRTKPRKNGLRMACAWSITSRLIASRSFSLKLPRKRSGENSSVTAFGGHPALERGNGTAATAPCISRN